MDILALIGAKYPILSFPGATVAVKGFLFHSVSMTFYLSFLSFGRIGGGGGGGGSKVSSMFTERYLLSQLCSR